MSPRVAFISLALAATLIAAAADIRAQEQAAPAKVKLFEEEFPKIMNATLVGRDCRDHDKEAQRELNAAVDQLIKYADPKPELASGVTKVFEGQQAYEQARVALGADFCEKRAPEIVEEGLKASRDMIAKLGLVAWDAEAVDVAKIEERLVEASTAIGAFDKCKRWLRDTDIAARGRTDAFVFMQGVVSDIRNEHEAIVAFLAKNGGSGDLAKRLESAEAKGRETGAEECSLKQYADLETELENIVQRQGLALQ